MLPFQNELDQRKFDEHRILLNQVYYAGFHDSQEIHNIVAKVTDLTLEQVSNCFQSRRWQSQKLGQPIPVRNVNYRRDRLERGVWNPTKRRILEVCFSRGFLVVENFRIVEVMTDLSKTQVSNWVRQKRFRLRKKGKIPPPARTRNAKLLQKQTKGVKLMAMSKKVVNTAPKVQRTCQFDKISCHILENALTQGLLEDAENLPTVALCAGVGKSELEYWLSTKRQ